MTSSTLPSLSMTACRMTLPSMRARRATSGYVGLDLLDEHRQDDVAGREDRLVADAALDAADDAADHAADDAARHAAGHAAFDAALDPLVLRRASGASGTISWGDSAAGRSPAGVGLISILGLRLRRAGRRRRRRRGGGGGGGAAPMNEIMKSGSWTACTMRYETPMMAPMTRTWAPIAIRKRPRLVARPRVRAFEHRVEHRSPRPCRSFEPAGGLRRCGSRSPSSGTRRPS